MVIGLAAKSSSFFRSCRVGYLEQNGGQKGGVIERPPQPGEV